MPNNTPHRRSDPKSIIFTITELVLDDYSLPTKLVYVLARLTEPLHDFKCVFAVQWGGRLDFALTPSNETG